VLSGSYTRPRFGRTSNRRNIFNLLQEISKEEKRLSEWSVIVSNVKQEGTDFVEKMKSMHEDKSSREFRFEKKLKKLTLEEIEQEVIIILFTILNSIHFIMIICHLFIASNVNLVVLFFYRSKIKESSQTRHSKRCKKRAHS
jgi:hypothetical protein